jgi:hypothetical protein
MCSYARVTLLFSRNHCPEMTEVGQAMNASRGVPQIRTFQTTISLRGEEAIYFSTCSELVFIFFDQGTLEGPRSMSKASCKKRTSWERVTFTCFPEHDSHNRVVDI